MLGLLFVAGWVGAIVLLSVANRAAEAEALDAFTRAAAKLRFSVEGASARGQLDVPLELVLLGTGQVRVTAALQPALGIGLSIAPRRGPVLTTDTRLNPSFDAEFVLDALELEQAIELVGGEVGRLLLRADAAGIDAAVSDESVTLLSPRAASAEAIAAAARAANDLAVHLVSRRPLLRTPRVERAFGKVLRGLARSLGAGVEPGGQLELRTETGRLTLRIERSRAGEQATRLRFHFARRLPAALQLSDERQRSNLARLLDSELQLDDAELDDAFVVRGASVAEVKALLDAPTRQALLRLWRSVHTLRVDDQEIDAWLPVVVTDPKKLLSLVESLRAAAAALSRDTKQQAYR